MNCQKCNTKCNELIRQDKKFCEDCKCSYLHHFNLDIFDKLSPNIDKLCNISKTMERSIEDSSKLAKTFGLMWLPIGIQPSEVDRFLRYFPVNSEIRNVMFLKSSARFIEIQFQIPFHDRSLMEIIFSIGEVEKDLCNEFFTERRNDNIDTGRLDYMDKSEGKVCNECSEIISFGEMCVLLSKQFQKEHLVWHPNCFKCIQCQHLLIDYLFCWDKRSDKGPYCIRHFDELFYPRCGSCDELIFEEKYASTMNESYHLDHLRCYICNEVLANTQFLLESDKSQDLKLWKCVSCLGISNEDLCRICHLSLNDSNNTVTTIDDSRVHKRCTTCDVCHQLFSISNPDSYVKEGANHIFCLNCYETRKLTQCQQCKEFVNFSDDSNVMNGRFIWHRTCLECFLCKKKLKEEHEFTVFDINGKISRACKPTFENARAICKECFMNKYEDRCDSCLKLINGDGVNYHSKLFHKSCFKCHNCFLELDIFRFTTKDDEFYCANCYSQLFCNTCFGCKSSIFATECDSRMVNFETRFWHEICFNCFNCKKPLLETGFLFDDDIINCLECAVKQ